MNPSSVDAWVSRQYVDLAVNFNQSQASQVSTESELHHLHDVAGEPPRMDLQQWNTNMDALLRNQCSNIRNPDEAQELLILTQQFPFADTLDASECVARLIGAVANDPQSSFNQVTRSFAHVMNLPRSEAVRHAGRFGVVVERLSKTAPWTESEKNFATLMAVSLNEDAIASLQAQSNELQAATLPDPTTSDDYVDPLGEWQRAYCDLAARNHATIDDSTRKAVVHSLTGLIASLPVDQRLVCVQLMLEEMTATGFDYKQAIALMDVIRDLSDDEAPKLRQELRRLTLHRMNSGDWSEADVYRASLFFRIQSSD